MPKTKKPAAVTWCDEHNRYFFYSTGCTREGVAQPEPTPAEVKAYYDWAKAWSASWDAKTARSN